MIIMIYITKGILAFWKDNEKVFFVLSFCDHFSVCTHTHTHTHKSVGKETKINKNQKKIRNLFIISNNRVEDLEFSSGHAMT